MAARLATGVKVGPWCCCLAKSKDGEIDPTGGWCGYLTAVPASKVPAPMPARSTTNSRLQTSPTLTVPESYLNLVRTSPHHDLLQLSANLQTIDGTCVASHPIPTAAQADTNRPPPVPTDRPRCSSHPVLRTYEYLCLVRSGNAGSQTGKVDAESCGNLVAGEIVWVGRAGGM